MRFLDSADTWPPMAGEMAEAIRQTDWSQTALGPSLQWPISLRIAVTTVLDSPLPSLVMWGPELIQIYNDAYAPLLGLRHPVALGQATHLCWPEVRQFNQPIFRQVMDTGEPVHLRDQPFTIEPSGVPETRYFTATYAALRDEGGTVGGVMVIAVETTQRILAECENQALLQATRFAIDQLKQMFELAPNFIIVLKSPQHVFEIVNASGRLMFAGRDVIGRALRQALPEMEKQGFIEILDRVYQSGETYAASNRLVSLSKPGGSSNGSLIEHYLDFVFQPIKDAQGQVCGIFVTGNDVTEHHRAQLELTRLNLDLNDNVLRLRAADARHAFQLTLADQLRPLATPEEVTAVASELLGNHLGVSRVVFCEINDANGTFFVRSDWSRDSRTSMADTTNALNAFGLEHVAALRSGQVSANPDVTLDPRTAGHAEAFAKLGIRADLAVPLVKSGVLTVVLALHHSVPHHWTDDEIAVVKDVAERTWAAVETTRAQAELRAERDQRQHIFDTIIDGFAIIGSDWRITQMNAEGLRIGLRTKLQVLEKNLWEIWPELIGTEFETVYRRVMTRRTAETFEQEINFSDGRSPSLAITVYPMLDGGLAAFVRDVTNHNAAVESVRASQTRAENALDIAQLGTFEWSADNNRVQCSSRTREIFGLNAAEGHITEDYFNRIVLIDRPRVRQEITSSFKTGRRLNSEYNIQLPDGTVRNIVNSSVCQTNLSGVWVRHTGVIRDVTAHKQAVEKLREVDRRKDEFLAMLAHELRNPLAPITTAARILSQLGIDQATLREMSAIVIRQADHMTRLIDDLLDVSRINKGLVALDRKVLDLKEVLRNAVEQVRTLIEKQNHEFSMKVTSETLHVAGDPVRLVQVFANILTNAAKYTPSGGKIELELAIVGSHAQVLVRDNGVGMSESLLPYIFDIFTQAERTLDRIQGGLGLGLSLVKNLVGLMGGTVTAHSEGPAMGSQFAVLLPRLVDESVKPVNPLPYFVDNVHVMHVMVVDDNVDAATTVAMLLELDGHTVSVAHSAEQALASALAGSPNPPQAFLLDIGLPGMDGYELARRLRAAPEMTGAILIALTGYGRPQDRERSLAAGFNHHIEKPVDAVRLQALLGGIQAI